MDKALVAKFDEYGEFQLLNSQLLDLISGGYPTQPALNFACIDPPDATCANVNCNTGTYENGYCVGGNILCNGVDIGCTGGTVVFC